MRRPSIAFHLILGLMLLASAGAAQWQKQGVASGTVNDILRVEGTSGTDWSWYLATEGGVFRSSVASGTWDYGAGLGNPAVKRIDGYRISPMNYMTAVLANDGIYARHSLGYYLWADTAGLHDDLNRPMGYEGATDVAVADMGGTPRVYLGFDGLGVWWRDFCDTYWCGDTLLADDAESDYGYWTASFGWSLTATQSHSGGSSWVAFRPAMRAWSSTLTLANPIDLGPDPDHGYQLRFWHYLDGTAADVSYVEIAADEPNFMAWDTLDSFSGSADGWGQRLYSLDLSGYTGPVKIRFRSEIESPQGTAVWYVDDIEVRRDWAQVAGSTGASIPNPNVTALQVYNPAGAPVLYAATHTVGAKQGDLYLFNAGAWTSKGVPGTNYLSLDGPYPGQAGALLAGTDGDGVHAWSGGPGFTRFCNAVPPAGKFVAVSVDKMDDAAGPFGAVTESRAYQLDPSCVTPYRPYADSSVRPISVLADCSATTPAPARFLVGTRGTGLMLMDCANLAAPPAPTGNEGQDGGASSKTITRLALSAGAQPTVFAASSSDGLFKSRFPVDGKDYFVRYFYDPATRGTLAGTAVALAPSYNDSTGPYRLYLGTARDGVYRSDDGGSSWGGLTQSPHGKRIVDLVTFPFGYYHSVFALTENGEVWYSFDEGNSWTKEADLGGGSTITAYDLAISANYNLDGVVFAATSAGLFKRAGVWATVPVLRGLPVLSVTLGNAFDDTNHSSTDDETRTVLAGTEGAGVWVSSTWGDAGSFSAVTTGTSLDDADIPVLTMHPASDLDPSGMDTLYHCFVGRHRTPQAEDGAYCMSKIQGGPAPWVVHAASGYSNPLPDARITDLAFHPSFNRFGPSDTILYAAHQNMKLFKGQYSNGTPFTYDFQPSSGFFHTPPFVYAVAESPDLPGVVLAGTKGYGPMMSFDGGISYYPWTAIQQGGYVLHDVFAAAFTHSTGSASRLLVSAGDPDYPSCIDKDFGVFYQDYASPAVLPPWERASLCLSGCTSPAAYAPANFDGHTVLELRYLNLTSDLLASDFTAGPLKSDPADAYVPGALGQYWQVDAGGTVPASLSDISAVGSGSTRAIDPRGLAGFVWGAQGKLSMGFARSNTPGAYRFNPTLTTAAWEAASGTTACALPVDKNWRAVLALNAFTVLIGGRDGSGIYRTGNADAVSNAGVCWSDASLGLNPYDRDGDGTQYSKRVTAFVKAANGTLASMEAVPASVARAGTGGEPGGVFFSDAASGGRAWVPVAANITCASSYELAGGSKVYTGTTCDGIYAATEVLYTGQPTAYFASAVDSACINEQVAFRNYTAGRRSDTHWSWDFGDGQTSAEASPRHAYASAGTMTVTLSAANYSFPGGTDTYMQTTPITITSNVELTIGTLKSVTKNGLGEAVLTWLDLGVGETGYQVWGSNDPSLPPVRVGGPLGPDVTTATVSGYMYFRVQPLSTGPCGDGAIGGSW